MHKQARGLSFLFAILLLAGCVPQPTVPAPVAAAPPPAPPPMVPFDQAVLNAGNAVFKTATTKGVTGVLVIDPLVNGVTGEQSASTRAIGDRLAELARQNYPQFDVQPFNAFSVGAPPIVVVGTFTPVNADFKPAGTRDAYRFCLRLADLRTGTIVAQSIARAEPTGVDSTPTAFFAESPAWTTDPAIKSYIDTCQTTKVGDPIPPAYLNGIITAAMVNQAIDAYDAGEYRQALDLYTAARSTAAGDQLRIYNGLYLTYTRLGDREHAAEAFGDIVDYGLRNKRLGVKLLFRSGSTVYAPQPFDGAYDMWLTQIAQRGAKTTACLQVTGHTSAEGSAVLNNQLSALRAQYVKEQLEQVAPTLQGRTIAVGAGAQKNLVGTATDNLADLLDRRVEFEIIPACTSAG